MEDLVESITFPSSKQFVKQQKRTLYWMAITMPLAVWLTAFFLFGWLSFTWIGVGILVAISLLIVGLIVLVGPFSLTGVRQMKVTLSPEAIIRTSRVVHTERIAYEDLSRVRFFQNRAGQVVRIHLASARHKMDLVGFEQMDLLLDKLEARLSNPSIVQHRRINLELNRPLLIPAVIILTSFACSSLIQNWGSATFQVGYAFFMVAFGLNAIFSKQVSRLWGSAFGKIDVIYGSFFIVVGLVTFASYAPRGLWGQPCTPVGRYIQQSGCIRLIHGGPAIAFTPEDETLILENFWTVEFRPISGWRALIPAPVKWFRQDSSVRDFAVSPDGGWLATWNWDLENDQTLWLWDVETRTLSGQHPIVGVEDVVFSPDSSVVALVSPLFRIELWRVNPWEQVLEIERVAGQVWPTAVAFSPDGQTIAAPASGDTIRLLRVADGAEVKVFHPSEGFMSGVVESLAFSPDGQFLAASTSNTELYVWRVADNQLHFAWQRQANDFQLRSNSPVVFSSDGRFIATAYYTREDYDGYVQLWQASDGTLLKEFNVGHRVSSVPESLAFSPDGQLLAVGTNQEAMIFDVNVLLQR
ncbi:MAG: hypothetical protein L0331_16690 [Chloroflexi bacterium]|nr:hypothetical protein [Chloroflexota bacterium]